MNEKTIALTGASGYIGGCLLQSAKAKGYRVVSLGRRPAMGSDRHIDFTLGGNLGSVSFDNVDVLVHAAYDFGPLGYTNISKVNHDGSIALFDKALSRGVKKIIFISTTSAFEGTLSDYGRVKYEIEVEALKRGLQVVRPGLVFGRNAGGIVGALNRFVQKFPFAPQIGNGRQIFYPCHVDDLGNALLYLAESDAKVVSPIVAASENSITFRDVLQVLAEAHHKRILCIPVPYFCLFLALKLAEAAHLKTGLRSDSLKYLKQPIPAIDFGFTQAHGLRFRDFTAMTVT